MSSAIEIFRAQQQAADAVYRRLQEVAVLLRELGSDVERLTSTTELKELLQREERWLQQTQQTLAAVRRSREADAWISRHSTVVRWVVAGAFGLLTAAVAGGGYAVATKPYSDEVQRLRARIALAELIEDQVLTMTPTERKQFDALMKWPKR